MQCAMPVYTLYTVHVYELLPCCVCCSVAQLSGVLRQAVEEENPLSHEIMMPGKTFYIEGVRLQPPFVVVIPFVGVCETAQWYIYS